MRASNTGDFGRGLETPSSIGATGEGWHETRRVGRASRREHEIAWRPRPEGPISRPGYGPYTSDARIVARLAVRKLTSQAAPTRSCSTSVSSAAAPKVRVHITSLTPNYPTASLSAATDSTSSSTPPRLLDASVAFRVVGVGASAGGMDAFCELLRNLPDDTGMAFVLIQHLHRTHANLLCETLATATRMIVSEVQASTRLVPNCVYVIPASADVTMRLNRLSLVPRPSDGGKPHAPVNLFLHSLAAARGHRAVGVLLSGNATDGTDGLRAVHAAHGVTMVQEPSSAKFGDMPRHALDAGVVDFCLPIPELARKLASLRDDPAPHTGGESDGPAQTQSLDIEAANSELESLNEGLMSTNRLLTARNDELRRVNGDLMNLLVSANVALVLLDREQRIRRFSPKAQILFNLRASDIGQPFHDLASTLSHHELQSHVAKVLDTLDVYEFELKDRFGRWARMDIRPHRTLQQRVDGVILSVVDIHDLKDHLEDATRAKREAEVARHAAERGNRRRDEFLSLVAHELRTPLASVLMHAQLLRSDGMERTRGDSALAAIERAVSMQTQLINDLVDLSLMEAGRLELELSAFDLGSVVEEILQSSAPSLARKSLRLRTDLDPSIGQIFSDPVRVRQVIGYVLSDAIRFTPAGGELQVRLSAEHGHACLCVHDSGVGVSPEFHVREHEGSLERRRGRLGLVVARQMVETLGGNVSVQSTGVDDGSTFRIMFPLKTTRVDRAKPEIPGSPIALHPLDRPGYTRGYAELQGVRILVLEDDEGTLEAVKTVLTLSGVVVRSAATVADALRELDRFEPQILVCDLALAGEDGLEFIRQVRARSPERAGLLPAMALTGLTSKQDRDRCFAAGVQLHVAKPVDIDTLRDAVIRLVRIDSASRQS